MPESLLRQATGIQKTRPAHTAARLATVTTAARSPGSGGDAGVSPDSDGPDHEPHCRGRGHQDQCRERNPQREAVEQRTSRQEQGRADDRWYPGGQDDACKNAETREARRRTRRGRSPAAKERDESARNHDGDQGDQGPDRQEEPTAVGVQRQEVGVRQRADVCQGLARLQEDVQPQVDRGVAHERDASRRGGLDHLQIGWKGEAGRREPLCGIHDLVKLDQVVARTNLHRDLTLDVFRRVHTRLVDELSGRVDRRSDQLTFLDPTPPVELHGRSAQVEDGRYAVGQVQRGRPRSPVATVPNPVPSPSRCTCASVRPGTR